MDSWLVAYDISDPKRLRKVAQTCEDFGVRKQLSIFLCRLSATDIVRLRNRLYDIVDRSKDQIIFLPTCERCLKNMETLGRPTDPPDAKDNVIVV